MMKVIVLNYIVVGIGVDDECELGNVVGLFVEYIIVGIGVNDE